MNNFKDSSIFNYEKKLINNNWTIKDKMYSADTLTVNSLASLFNFNFKTIDQTSLSIPFSLTRLRRSTLYDSLEKKKIKFYNYGIFDVGKSKAMSKIYFYKTELQKNNFVRDFFSKTLIINFLNIDNQSLHIKHNQSIIELTNNRLNNIENNSFVYNFIILFLFLI